MDSVIKTSDSRRVNNSKKTRKMVVTDGRRVGKSRLRVKSSRKKRIGKKENKHQKQYEWINH